MLWLSILLFVSYASVAQHLIHQLCKAICDGEISSINEYVQAFIAQFHCVLLGIPGKRFCKAMKQQCISLRASSQQPDKSNRLVKCQAF